MALSEIFALDSRSDVTWMDFFSRRMRFLQQYKSLTMRWCSDSKLFAFVSHPRFLIKSTFYASFFCPRWSLSSFPSSKFPKYGHFSIQFSVSFVTFVSWNLWLWRHHVTQPYIGLLVTVTCYRYHYRHYNRHRHHQRSQPNAVVHA